MRFGDLLNVKAIALRIEAEGKESVIQTLINQLADHGAIKDREKAFSAVMERERALSTGVGQGVGVPHATLAELEEPVVAFARLSKTIDFQSLDGSDVDLVFLLLAPENEIALHLKLLSRVSRLCNSPEFRKSLREVASPEEILAIVREHESSYREF